MLILLMEILLKLGELIDITMIDITMIDITMGNIFGKYIKWFGGMGLKFKLLLVRIFRNHEKSGKCRNSIERYASAKSPYQNRYFANTSKKLKNRKIEK